ncbi:flavodoxin reductase [Chitinophaga nivalis]|uniref:Flavodoxin reductase n=1 Tax=Chitinophaga nivalis TaxID=2991709 RepID=A0ABT3IRX7_9BACT|nr:flavodoxin reductase [Chitinophaga nivalis]MCW3463587.1 flavodoxin reductase [Chitinophaga nivalis]MCW3486723.1 flavodoxin reductase [Chitinophaga nivalis]
MESHIVKIVAVTPVTHNVKRFTVEKPEGYRFVPGQATEVAINKPGWEEERRPFTFTGLNDWAHLEFTIKIYDDHHSVTEQLGLLQAGDELILHDVWGAIHYKGEGVFIAGGAGVTPFIAIFRALEQEGRLGNNRLICSNKTAADIILKAEFEQLLGPGFINTLTQEQVPGYDHQVIDEAYLKAHITDFQQYFYICGPDPMVQQLKDTLTRLAGNEALVTVEI